MGRPDGELVAGALASARAHGLAHQVLGSEALRRRFPVFTVEDDWTGVYEDQAGWLAPERCIEAHLRLAKRSGAELRFSAPVASWERDGEGIRVGSDRAARLVLTAGAWMGQLLPRLAAHLWVERSVLFWFEPLRDREAFESLPVYIVDDTDRIYYGFPLDREHGVKVAGLHFGDRADPDAIDREPNATDEQRVRAWLRRRMPAANGERRLAKVCMYTNSPDGHFIVDRDGPVSFASACSGHGFKFASAIGELLAGLATVDQPAPPFLRADRLIVTAS
jgi:sarcosine oxidase